MKEEKKYSFHCLICNQRIEDASEEIPQCPKCNGPISIQMNIEQLILPSSTNKHYNLNIIITLGAIHQDAFSIKKY